MFLRWQGAPVVLPPVSDSVSSSTVHGRSDEAKSAAARVASRPWTQVNDPAHTPAQLEACWESATRPHLVSYNGPRN